VELWRSRTEKGSSGGEEEGGGVRSGPGEARTILLLHIISVRPSKQPLMVRTFLKVYMELGSYFLFLQEQIKDIIIILCNSYDGTGESERERERE
jgi:GTPase involved in cell partitioning and DNA repair